MLRACCAAQGCAAGGTRMKTGPGYLQVGAFHHPRGGMGTSSHGLALP